MDYQIRDLRVGIFANFTLKSLEATIRATAVLHFFPRQCANNKFSTNQFYQSYNVFVYRKRITYFINLIYFNQVLYLSYLTAVFSLKHGLSLSNCLVVITGGKTLIIKHLFAKIKVLCYFCALKHSIISPKRMQNFIQCVKTSIIMIFTTAYSISTIQLTLINISARVPRAQATSQTHITEYNRRIFEYKLISIQVLRHSRCCVCQIALEYSEAHEIEPLLPLAMSPSR